VQRPWADRIGAEIGATELQATLATMRRMVATLEAEEAALRSAVQ
jgi:hypothetical protein